MKLIKLLILFSMVSFAANAAKLHEYTSPCTIAVSGSATCTLQVPVNNTRWVFVSKFFIQCDAQMTVTQDVNGAAATATLVSGATKKRNDRLSWVAAPTTAVYSPSNAGVGTAQGNAVVITANSGIPFDLGRWLPDGSFSGLIFEKGNALVQNHNIRLAGTGNCTVSWETDERNSYN